VVAGDLKAMAAPTVVLTDGDDASGMASMLAGLLEGNLGDFPSRERVARAIRGAVVFTAADRDLSVTITFLGDRIEVCDGVAAGATMIRAPWMTMAKLCSGQVSPLRALIDRDLAISLGRSPLAAAGASFVVSVPPSYYGDDRRLKKGSVIAVLTVISIGAIILRRRRVASQMSSGLGGGPMNGR